MAANLPGSQPRPHMRRILPAPALTKRPTSPPPQQPPPKARAPKVVAACAECRKHKCRVRLSATLLGFSSVPFATPSCDFRVCRLLAVCSPLLTHSPPRSLVLGRKTDLPSLPHTKHPLPLPRRGDPGSPPADQQGTAGPGQRERGDPAAPEEPARPGSPRRLGAAPLRRQRLRHRQPGQGRRSAAPAGRRARDPLPL